MKITNLLNPEDQSKRTAKNRFAMDVLTGLCEKPKRIPSKYFYDDKGSKLFQEITQQPDYYLTNVELELLKKHQKVLPDLVGTEEIDIIELGAGDGHKTKIIIDSFLDVGTKVNFYPIDISAEAMELLNQNMQVNDDLNIHGIVAEYIEGLRYIRQHSKNHCIVLFLGSNLGNFEKVQGLVFLRMLWKVMNKDDYLLTGFDLRKDINKLLSAYNDSKGVTREFNLNLLDRMNKELGGNFDRNKFQHFGTYNPLMGAMESYLISLEEQEVYIEALEKKFKFSAFEPIHLEYSFKYLLKDVEFFAEEAGYSIVQQLMDDHKSFVDSLWKVEKH